MIIIKNKLTELENLTGNKLPESFKNFYIAGNEFDSLETIIDNWMLLNKVHASSEPELLEASPDIGIKNNWWHPAWIPIIGDGCGNYHCLDLAPTEKGNYGQVIQFLHDSDERILVASSIDNWLLEY